ncbi:histidine phosphatase family protein [Mycolicibacterium sp. CBMA 234]|uniref:histidine phosphatase family protein n=1 Tax=Mycolicibacterium sp. CBMA 234 TaxID=1918495 RepID=UPI002815D41D|nr:histidine phosphatase family protein [Mycolicibacterium sp. CBMA 234]
MITLTLVRHGESRGNASGLIDSSVPGPSLTDLGESQAMSLANRLKSNAYDGVFASSMIRTQQSALPIAQLLAKDITVLPGLREIEAGTYEGTPEAKAATGYLRTILAWAHGKREERIPGSIDGNDFEKRFNDAVETICNRGDTHPIAFSHGGAITAWVLMNAVNARTAVPASSTLPNTGYVVLQGDPKNGWTVTDWNGTPVA